MANNFSITCNGFPEETLTTNNLFWKNLLYSPCNIGSIIHRLLYKTADNINQTKYLDKAVLIWDSSIFTAIGNELAKLYNHIEHYQDTNYL